MTTQLPLTKAQKDALYLKYFEKLENPALVILNADGQYKSSYNQLNIPEADILNLGMGVIIEQEDSGKSPWF